MQIMKSQRRSKITHPNDGAAKPELVAFRTSKPLAQLLNGVDNKSAFINEALMEKFGRDHFVTCTACHGEGKVHKRKAS